MNNKLSTKQSGIPVQLASTQQGLQKIFTAEVIFGSPASKCAGAGICKINSPITHHPIATGCLNCNRSIALFNLEASDSVTAHFLRKSMRADVVQKYFDNGFFILESPFRFKKNYGNGLKSKSIPAGLYTVEKSEDYLTVRFNLISYSTI